ncbi:MAG TPA: AAA family ATPase [Gemmatimonadaceae bacterium]|nr:AAA family ATPase [Gemmatimonadaceae bacterium]
MPPVTASRLRREELVVEFLGLPASGKSTLSHAVARALRARDVPVREPTYTLDHETAIGARRVRKLALAALAVMRHPARSAHWVRRIARSGQRRSGWASAVAINWLYLLEVARGGAARPGVCLLDQGLLQALWSIGYGARAFRLRSPGLRTRLRALLPRRVMVVLVTADRAALERRLDGRDHPASRLERERGAVPRPGAADDGGASPMDRGAALMDEVAEVARRLAEQRRIVLLCVESAESSLPATVAAITDAVLALLSPPDVSAASVAGGAGALPSGTAPSPPAPIPQ